MRHSYHLVRDGSQRPFWPRVMLPSPAWVPTQQRSCPIKPWAAVAGVGRCAVAWSFHRNKSILSGASPRLSSQLPAWNLHGSPHDACPGRWRVLGSSVTCSLPAQRLSPVSLGVQQLGPCTEPGPLMPCLAQYHPDPGHQQDI